jgi:large conductance mechanosensitive channel
MKNFFDEFKKFITRGNVVDMAVGVIVGSSFTAIVNAMSNNILKPLINYLLALLFSASSLTDVYTFLKRAEKDIFDEAGEIIGRELDLSASIYIDWGAFINAVLNFFLVAFVLFSIVKIVNKFREEHKEFAEKIAKKTLDRAERRELREAGVNIRDREAVKAYFAEKKRLVEEAAAKTAREAEEKAKAERAANPTAEDLLKEIRDLLKNK